MDPPAWLSHYPDSPRRTDGLSSAVGFYLGAVTEVGNVSYEDEFAEE